MVLVADGIKKWSTIVATAPLPAGLRVAVRRHFLSRLELGKAHRAGLVIIGHPKSGNTWLRTMISHLYHARHGIPDSLVIKSDELARRNAAVPRFTATNGIYSYEGSVGDALDPDSPDPILQNKPIILLARNPLDIAVSWYIQFTKRQSAHKQELINHFIDHPIDRKTIQRWDFVRHSDIGLPFLIDFLNEWHRKLSSHPRFMLVRYEDLRAKPAETLKRIMDHMGETFSDAEIEEAVAFGSFDNLRKLESEGHFKQGGLSRRNVQDPETFKVRRAKVGGYRDYFTPEQSAELETLMNERLSPVFGYTPVTLATEKASSSAEQGPCGQEAAG